ncbi:MAG: ornithine cyclodeaminase family protein, partial [Nitrospinae bacterium]|nr:ornithine cyclodeaminase family protein [Nitrospinota bacterium]
MLYLSESDVKSLVNMSDVMDVVEKCFKAQGEGRAPNQPRRRVFLPKGTMHVMFGGMVDENEGYLGLKAYTTFPGIGVRFIFLLWDANTSEMLSLMEANIQGQMRTGAASGVAAKYMAREDAAVAGLIGTGWQARSQLEALCCARDLEVVKVHSRRPEKREKFVSAMQDR